MNSVLSLLLFAARAAVWAACLALLACGSAGAEDQKAPEATPENNAVCEPSAVVLEIDGLRAVPGPLAGQVRLTFKTPLETSTPVPIEGFVVRAQAAHLTARNAADAPIVTESVRTTDPDGTEHLLLSGLEPGRVLQFTVQATRGGKAGGCAPGVSSRVTGRWSPVAPATVLPLAAAATLSQEGGYYRLTQDVVATGSAFHVTARDVTLDLAGHTVTYGSASSDSYGVHSSFLYNRGTFTVFGGTLRQGGTRSRCDAIHLRGGHDVRISRVSIVVQGPDSDGIEIADGVTGDVRIDHCTIACNTTVVSNRHSPGVNAIRAQECTQSMEIDSNLITASPQWGIKVTATETKGALLIHHNRIRGTRARVANGYMLGIHQPKADVFENELVGESRGIHLDGIDAHGHGAWIHDNVIRAQDQPNTEFPTHWCHGIKVEGPSTATIQDNLVWVGADATHSEARALDLTLTGSSAITIHGNRFEGVSTVPQHAGIALHWTDGHAASADAGKLSLAGNVFRATDRLIHRSWESKFGSTLRGNVWVRDVSQGAAHPFVFERFANADNVASRGHGLLDSITTEDWRVVSQWATPGPYESDRRATVRIDVRTQVGTPVANASVEFRDPGGTRVLALVTDASGLATGTLRVDRITPGPTVSKAGPFEVRITKSGVGTYSGAHDVRSRFALRVNLEADTATVDTVAPAAPAAPRARVLSATRVELRWLPPTGATDIVAYLVYVDGAPAVVCQTTACILSGLTPATACSIAVQAIDGAGLRSVVGPVTACTPGAEDRGP